MAKLATAFVCQSCGHTASKWTGKCDGCGSWNSFAEESSQGSDFASGVRGRSGRVVPLVGLKGVSETPPRLLTGLPEFDRVVGGGLVPASAVLVGGDPGIGKSTLVLQALASLAGKGVPAIYISGEEGIEQTRLRAHRLGLDNAPLSIAAETSLRDIIATLDSGTPPAALAIDSLQTLFSDALEAAPGTVSQVRTCALELIRFAKKRNIALILIGHVTKDGQVAGPRVVEHMVDAVLYFEGERGHNFRILRGVKNRFGATDEIGVFSMTDRGLAEVPNPSALFLGPRDQVVTGAAVFAGIEGTRPILVEIQALVAPASFGAPRRAVVGWDTGRLAMILAVLDSRSGLALAGHDVYLNVAGGLRIAEPAADLAAAAALVSSFLGKPVPPDTVLFGEIGLTGTVRPVAQADARLKEAQKLGFKGVIAPPSASPGTRDGLRAQSVGSVTELLTVLGA